MEKEVAIEGGIYFFDNKLFIVKAWNSYMEFTREELLIIPIWVMFWGLDFKYQCPRVLSNNRQPHGETIDGGSMCWEEIGLNFARLLVEMDMDSN